MYVYDKKKEGKKIHSKYINSRKNVIKTDCASDHCGKPNLPRNIKIIKTNQRLLP